MGRGGPSPGEHIRPVPAREAGHRPSPTSSAPYRALWPAPRAHTTLPSPASSGRTKPAEPTTRGSSRPAPSHTPGSPVDVRLLRPTSKSPAAQGPSAAHPSASELTLDPEAQLGTHSEPRTDRGPPATALGRTLTLSQSSRLSGPEGTPKATCAAPPGTEVTLTALLTLLLLPMASQQRGPGSGCGSLSPKR